MASSGTHSACQELSDVVNELWKLDVNRLEPGKDYTINLQGKAGFVEKGSNKASDKASRPLFSYVNEDKLKSMKTYAYFISLLDNYEASTGVEETETSEELAENQRFLDAILETEVMKRAHKYLSSKGLSPTETSLFKTQLNDIWFRLYHRDRNSGLDSCGFEHVFVGETKVSKEVIGFHNWIQFYLQEKLNLVDYKGYVAKDHRDVPSEHDHVVTLQFSWKGLVKPMGSSFIGVSPEFEFALYTIIFLLTKDRVPNATVTVDKYLVEIVVFRHGRAIGTAYPKLLSNRSKRP